MNISGKQIFNLRKKKGLTQAEFAEKIGFSQSYLKDIELGRSEPSRNILKSVSTVFNISTDWILFGGDIKKRASSFLDLLYKCLIDDSQERHPGEKKIFDHLKGIDNLTKYEISFYIYKLLTLYYERGIETKTLLILPEQNYIIQTPGSYHAFLGFPMSEDSFADNVISHSIIITHSVFHRFKFPIFEDRPAQDCFLRIENNKVFFPPLDKFYEPHELFTNTREDRVSPNPLWPHENRERRKESIEKYFSEIDPTQTIKDADVDFRLSDVEKSVMNVLRSIDQDSLKDLYALLAAKGSRLEKEKRDSIKKDIRELQKSAK